MSTRVSAFTFVRNALLMDYPFEESILSALPVCDEFIVNVCSSEDATLERVRTLAERHSRIRIIESDWDADLRRDGRILSNQTNRALDAVDGQWALYLQADECLHEDDQPALSAAILQADSDGLLALRFPYLHFVGGYSTRAPADDGHFYATEVRVVRVGAGIRSWGDAQGFRDAEGNQLIEGHPGVRMENGVRIFHYGWARHPDRMRAKAAAIEKVYFRPAEWRRRRRASVFNPKMDRVLTAGLANLLPFPGGERRHPAVMADRVRACDWSPEDLRCRLGPRPRLGATLFRARRNLVRLFNSGNDRNQ